MRTNGLIASEDGKEYAVLCQPGLIRNRIRFGDSSYNPQIVFEKCSRNFMRDPAIKAYVSKKKLVNIVVIGLEINICMWESVMELLKH